MFSLSNKEGVMWALSEIVALHNPNQELLQKNQHLGGTVNLDFSDPTNVRNKFLLFQISGYGILLW